ncbi:TetR/AcrR family transcriptional regulator C-terminal domain-containing protein [Eubacteriales bacterium OttesenSCG-928-A19]|nr:TetR/AcrR family transcriptional regulator C-terminal domain-containing protein [Eubacteriales bacterium OttesenSCG-928-A19]
MPDSNITKKALATAMKTLMLQQPFAKISVGDICGECGMNRKSFYYHFRDKYELVNWIFHTEFLEAVGTQPYEDSWAFLLDMFRYFHNNRVFYVNALSVTGQDSFREYFGEVFQPIILVAMEEAFSNAQRGEFYSVFFTDALLMAIERWLREGTMQPEELAELLREGIEGTAVRVVKSMDLPEGKERT